LINELEFDHSFSFIYSARPGTPASAFVDSVTDETKKTRLKLVQDRLREFENQHSDKMVGSIQRLLVERLGQRYEGDLAGRTENNRVVNFTGDAALIGRFVDVKITEAYTNSLRGELLADSVVL